MAMTVLAVFAGRTARRAHDRRGLLTHTGMRERRLDYGFLINPTGSMDGVGDGA
jgi:hypothetical protein